MRVALGVLLCIGIVAPVTADVAGDINALTGNVHTRVVWLEGGDKLTGGGKLMGFDTKTRRAAQVLPAASGQRRPIICTGGTRVVVTIGGKVYRVNWDGSGKRFIANGMASDVWTEPSTGKEWVVVRVGPSTSGGRVVRYRLDDPSKTFTLCDVVGGGFDEVSWWQISGDGTMAVEFLPWPNGYVVQDGGLTKNGKRTWVTNGCWSSVAPDNSYYWFVFSGSHSILRVHNKTTKVADAAIDVQPPYSGYNSFYHPKFASKGAKFLTLTGGFDENSNRDKAEVYVGKFANDYKSFAGWARVTTNSASDYTPDVWVGVESTVPSIRLAADKITFEAREGGSNPAARELSVATPYGTLSGVTAASNRDWLSVSVSGSGSSYTVNNTVSASSLSAGIHTATVTVSADNATPNSATYEVVLTVTGSSTPTSVKVAPGDASVAVGGTQQFTAELLDQDGNPMSSQPSFEWSVEGSGNTITNDGRFTAGAGSGSYTVTASTSSLEGSATVTVTGESRTINLTNPSQDATLAVNSLLAIKWNATSDIQDVVIEVSPDGGKSWYWIVDNAITREHDSWGRYEWVVASSVKDATGNTVGIESDNVKFRVSGYQNPEVFDVTDAAFTIKMTGVIFHSTRRAAQRLTVEVAGGLLNVSVPWKGDHRVELHDQSGRRLTGIRGSGPRQYVVDGATSPGVYLVRVVSPRSMVVRKVRMMR